ncbi:hypothetical protein M8C21_007296 [Ambrosia artemisiifolia]|uniref:Uncharacterized protein n=1 Tax=Ambrosia artemisiifolia TaxID=4212 RepID=A0AAD5CRG2_AMBAR|nr:hypothetical protein M8C21_007296 [Ambrosia artemisiifolia]
MESGFYHDQTLSGGSNRHAISFKPSVVDSTREVIMMGDYYRMNNNNNNVSSMVFSGNYGMVYSGSVYAQIGNSSTSNVSDSIAGLKHDAGLAVEWSAEEQCKLEEGICKTGQWKALSGDRDQKDDITEACSQMVLQLHNIYDSDKIKVKIKVISGTLSGGGCSSKENPNRMDCFG